MDKGSQRLREGRTNKTGALYFLTTFKSEAADRLDDELGFKVIEDALYSLEKEGVWEWQAFVIMPDHAHMIVRLGGKLGLSKAMQKFKSITAIEINRQRGANGAVWFKGFYDRMIRERDDAGAYLRYILNNPVKKGLVKRASEYKYLRVKNEFREQARSHN